MLGGNAVETPAGHGHITRIEWLGQNGCYFLSVYFAVPILREEGIVLEEALHLSLRFKTARCKSFESLLDGRGNRLVRHEHLTAMTRYAIEAIAYRRQPCPIAVAGAGLHAVLGLLSILLSLVL